MMKNVKKGFEIAKRLKPTIALENQVRISDRSNSLTAILRLRSVLYGKIRRLISYLVPYVSHIVCMSARHQQCKQHNNSNKDLLLVRAAHNNQYSSVQE
jgi:hypothetical protein